MPRGSVESDVLQYAGFVCAIAEAHFVKYNVAAQGTIWLVGADVYGFSFSADNVYDATKGDNACGKVYNEAAQVAHGPDDPA